MIPASQWASAWADYESTTIQQAALAEADLDRWLAGAPHASFDPFKKLLMPLVGKIKHFAEIGAGAGYYSEALRHIDKTVIYAGFDISQFMVDYANRRWGRKFYLSSSEKLNSFDEKFDIVCLSGLIQHLADYRPSIREAARVSKRYVLLHRAECTSGPNYEFVRRSYDSDVPVRKVNEAELLLFCGLAGLVLRQRETWGGDAANWSGSYLFEKS